MKNQTSLNFTDFQILKYLWKKGGQSAKEIHDIIGADNEWSYSTTRTMLERMRIKGHIKKEAFHGLNIYEASISKPKAMASLIRNLATKVLEVDYSPLVSLFAEKEILTKKEISELKKILEKDTK